MSVNLGTESILAVDGIERNQGSEPFECEGVRRLYVGEEPYIQPGS